MHKCIPYNPIQPYGSTVGDGVYDVPPPPTHAKSRPWQIATGGKGILLYTRYYLWVDSVTAKGISMALSTASATARNSSALSTPV